MSFCARAEYEDSKYGVFSCRLFEKKQVRAEQSDHYQQIDSYTCNGVKQKNILELLQKWKLK